MVLRRVLIAAACVLALACGGLLSGCGNDKKQGVDEPAREGLALNMAGVDYNVYITRQLNPEVPPDGAYWSGPEPGKGETLYGVFLSACNRTDELQQTAAFFTVTDNQHNEFKPETLPRDNPFAYRPVTLKPDECIPEAGSVAQLGPRRPPCWCSSFRWPTPRTGRSSSRSRACARTRSSPTTWISESSRCSPDHRSGSAPPELALLREGLLEHQPRRRGRRVRAGAAHARAARPARCAVA